MSKVLYLTKKVFDCNLTIAEVRLLMIISSDKQFDVNNLTKKEKMAIVGNAKKYNLLPQMMNHLIQLDLLSTEGQGKEIRDYFVIFDSFEEIKTAKNLRQLFFLCIPKWHKHKPSTIISIERFHNLFGHTVENINRYWKRTNQQMGTAYQWEKVDGKIKITNEGQEEENHEIQCNIVEDYHEIPQEYIDNQFDCIFGVDMDY